MSDKLPHVQVQEAICKSIGDMAKENQRLEDRIKMLDLQLQEEHISQVERENKRNRTNDRTN
jgi:hypothetical protein